MASRNRDGLRESAQLEIAPRRGFSNETWRPETVEWYTPAWLFAALGLAFDLDPCAPEGGVPWVPAARHFTRADDGLAQRWTGRVWLNPPYGAELPRWVGRLADHGDGIALVLSRTDTRWFHRAMEVAEVVCFLRGRLDFVPGPGVRASRPQVGAILLPFGATCTAAVERARIGTCMRRTSASSSSAGETLS